MPFYHTGLTNQSIQQPSNWAGLGFPNRGNSYFPTAAYPKGAISCSTYRTGGTPTNPYYLVGFTLNDASLEGNTFCFHFTGYTSTPLQYLGGTFTSDFLSGVTYDGTNWQTQAFPGPYTIWEFDIINASQGSYLNYFATCRLTYGAIMIPYFGQTGQAQYPSSWAFLAVDMNVSSA